MNLQLIITVHGLTQVEMSNVTELLFTFLQLGFLNAYLFGPKTFLQ